MVKGADAVVNEIRQVLDNSEHSYLAVEHALDHLRSFYSQQAALYMEDSALKDIMAETTTNQIGI